MQRPVRPYPDRLGAARCCWACRWGEQGTLLQFRVAFLSYTIFMMWPCTVVLSGVCLLCIACVYLHIRCTTTPRQMSSATMYPRTWLASGTTRWRTLPCMPLNVCVAPPPRLLDSMHDLAPPVCVCAMWAGVWCVLRCALRSCQRYVRGAPPFRFPHTCIRLPCCASL